MAQQYYYLGNSVTSIVVLLFSLLIFLSTLLA